MARMFLLVLRNLFRSKAVSYLAVDLTLPQGALDKQDTLVHANVSKHRPEAYPLSLRLTRDEICVHHCISFIPFLNRDFLSALKFSRLFILQALLYK